MYFYNKSELFKIETILYIHAYMNTKLKQQQNSCGSYKLIRNINNRFVIQKSLITRLIPLAIILE